MPVEIYEQDILDLDAWSAHDSYDLIVSNPPYIPEKERTLVPANVARYEPEISLFVENEDPFIFYKRICQFSKEHLNPDGYVFFETNEFNAQELKAWMKNEMMMNIELKKDLMGKDRMIKAWF